MVNYTNESKYYGTEYVGQIGLTSAAHHGDLMIDRFSCHSVSTSRNIMSCSALRRDLANRSVMRHLLFLYGVWRLSFWWNYEFLFGRLLGLCFHAPFLFCFFMLFCGSAVLLFPATAFLASLRLCFSASPLYRFFLLKVKYFRRCTL